MKKNNQSVPVFSTIALKNIKNKQTKEGTLQDLFKCISSLDDSRVSLAEYASSIREASHQQELQKYLNGLKTIEERLLAMAQQNISSRGKVDQMLDEQI
jgi:hypothetical protein